MKSIVPKSLLTATVLSAALLGGQVGLAYAQSPPASSVSSEPQLHRQKLAEASCAACHGNDGNNVDVQYPKIAGQRASYLRLQLRAFKSGARKSDIMSGSVSALSDTQIVELARYYSRQSVKPDVVNDPQLASIGARIYRYASRAAPPCVACHGGEFGPSYGHGGMMGGHMGMMMGGLPEAPNLYGQHAAYLVQQLNAFAKGERRSSIMGPIAAAWREQERRAVAEYLSGLQ